MLGILHPECKHKQALLEQGSSFSAVPGYAGCGEQLLASEVRLCATLTATLSTGQLSGKESVSGRADLSATWPYLGL